MAYLSDHILFASLLPYGYHQVLGDPEIEFMTSLDHSLYFHSAATDASHYLDPLQPFFNAHQIFDPSQWHLFQIQCSHVSHQLAQVDGKLMNKQGFLFMQVTQQGLVRLKSSKL